MMNENSLEIHRMASTEKMLRAANERDKRLRGALITQRARLTFERRPSTVR